MQCPICHTSARPEANFCDMCGFVFGSSAPAEEMPNCARCGVAQRPGARVCSACGALLLISPTMLLGHRLDGGRYTVQRLISRGGMGGIYLASDHADADRAVVIKTLRTAISGQVDPSYLQEQARLRHEAQLLALTRHRAIPHLFRTFSEENQTFLVMQHIDGDNLLRGLSHFDEVRQQSIPGSAYPPEDVLEWGILLCEVLEHLAELPSGAVIHQDIKPSNLVLDRTLGDLYLIDFGTAVQQGVTEEELLQAFGTPGYAAPEQYRGQIEQRSDVYALASTLYHLLTDDDPGDHPFQFPRLGELGPLGAVLRDALDTELERRPGPTELRQRLEALRDPHNLRLLRAPDGSRFTDLPALIAWCERHWAEAARWLYSTMPNQIERWHGPGLARELRSVTENSDPYAALDAALALLDPHGFGAHQPRLISATRVLDFGRGRQLAPQMLAIANGGRRYVRASVQPPAWIETRHSEVALPPGQQIILTLSIRPGTAVRPRDTLRLYDGSTTVLACEIRAKTGWRRFVPF